MTTSPTIRDVARLAGVSVATVSRYLNQTAALSPETAQRVQEAMQSLAFAPHAAARHLATQRTHTVGLLIPEIKGDYFTLLLRGIEKEIRESGYSLLIATCPLNLPSGVPWPLGPQNTDGILVFLETTSGEQLEQLAAKSFPLVMIHHTPPPELTIPSVTIENKNSLVRVVDHLSQVHHRRRIVFLRGPENNQDAVWRELGYHAGLEKNGLPFDADLVGRGYYDRRVAYQETLRLFSQLTDLDAIFTGDDEGAIGVLSALGELGIRVPEQVSVIGFDDQLVAPYLSPPLTTIHAPTEQIGQAAARELIHLIETGQAEPLTMLPTELILRRSCGCTPHQGDLR